MTAQTDTKLPEWPKADEFGYAFDELSAKDAALRFQRARADAAMARLRVAVEALEFARGEMANTREFRHGWPLNVEAVRRVDAALSTIGPLPPPQMPTPLPGEGE